MSIRVKAYHYLRKGKTIFVPSYQRKGGPKGGGEYRKHRGSLVEFTDWGSLQDEMNVIGWENSTLFKSRQFKIENGKKTLNISDPRHGSDKYFGLKSGKSLVGVTNVSEGSDGIWIGDFEVFPKYQHNGYGKRMFRQLQKRYPGQRIILTYRDNKAKKFWESLGFSPSKNSHVMIFEQ